MPPPLLVRLGYVHTAGIASSVSWVLARDTHTHKGRYEWERAGGIGWEGEGADAGVGAVGGKRDAGAALDRVDRLVFSRTAEAQSVAHLLPGSGWWWRW